MRKSRRSVLRDSLLVTAGCGLILLLQLFYFDGGFLDGESSAFLYNYLDGRPLAEKIFDPLRNDWGFYQARELSYLFDWFDSQFIAASIRAGWIHFHSVSAWLMITLTVFVQQYGFRKVFPRLPGWVVTSLSCLFVLTPYVYENHFFRSSKYGCALFFTVAGMLTLALIFRRCGDRRNLAVSGIFVSLLAASLFDRQGAFFAAGYAGAAGLLVLAQLWCSKFLLAWRVSVRTMELSGRVALGALGAVALAGFYNLKIAPELVWMLNGYMPSFYYQNVDGLPLRAFPLGGRFVFSNLGCSMSGMRGDAATLLGLEIAVALGIWFLVLAFRRGSARLLLTAGMTAALFAGMWIAAAGMVTRHPSILIPDVMYGLYFLPGWTLVILILGVAAEYARRTLPKFNVAGAVFLAVIVIHLGGYLMLYQINPVPQHLAIFAERSEIVKLAIKDRSYDFRKEVLPLRMVQLIYLFR